MVTWPDSKVATPTGVIPDWSYRVKLNIYRREDIDNGLLRSLRKKLAEREGSKISNYIYLYINISVLLLL